MLHITVILSAVKLTCLIYTCVIYTVSEQLSYFKLYVTLLWLHCSGFYNIVNVMYVHR